MERLGSKFPAGTEMKIVVSATYIGGVLANAKGDVMNKNTQHRIQTACFLAKALYQNFKGAACSFF